MRNPFLLVVLATVLAGCGPKHTAVNAPAPVPSPTAPERHCDPKTGKGCPAVDHSITLTWQQSFANNGACSATTTVSCISGFNQGFISGTSTQNQLHTDTAAVCTGTTQPENCTATFNGVLPIGNVVFYVATTFVRQDGTAGVTVPALSAPVVVSADSAQNVTVTINN